MKFAGQLLISLALLFAVTQAVEHKFCPGLQCADKPTEIEKWKCINSYLFAAVPEGTNPADEYYVEHDCGGVGWGNSIRGLYNAAALAAMLGRRLIVTHGPFNRMFLPPDVNNPSWTYGLKEGGNNMYAIRQHWDFEKHGRAPDRYQPFAESVKANPASVVEEYEKHVMVAGVCGGEREIMTKGGCLSEAMPNFIGCAASRTSGGYMQDNMLAVPFFTSLFSRPSPLLGSYMEKIRTKLGLPMLAAGTEPAPGAWGLRTPGYYIFALHFRNVPVGFEPLSIDLNRPRTKNNRNGILDGFWHAAEKHAKKARQLAKCRGQELLIYFATDDVALLRPEAQKRLGQYGRVVFGLDEHEVGHMSPQWSKTDEQLLARAQQDKTVEHLHSYHAPPDEALEEIMDANGDPIKAKDDFHSINTPKDKDSVNLHGDMAMVEWWILSQANWLMGHSGTSFSDSASGVGLSPMGQMERMDLVHGMNHVSTSQRRDWDHDSCTVVGAADPAFRETCPNVKGEEEVDDNGETVHA